MALSYQNLEEFRLRMEMTLLSNFLLPKLMVSIQLHTVIA